MSFRTLTVAFLTLFLIATIATGIATYAVDGSTIVRLVDERIEAVSDAVAGDGAGDGADDGGSLTTVRAIARVARLAHRRDTGDIGFVLTDAHGRVLIANVRSPRRLAEGFSTLRRTDRIDGLSAGRAYVRRLDDGMTLTTIAETEPFDHYAIARRWIFLGGFGAIVVIVIGGVAAFGQAIAGRMRTMRRTVDAIVAGDLSRRLPVGSRADEFDRQADAFNHMIDRMVVLIDGLRTVSNDVAHDLRTPLSRLRSHLDGIARRVEAVALRGDVEEAIRQADDLLDMLAAMLRISEIEASARLSGFEPIALDRFTADIAAIYEPVAADGGRRLVVGRIDHAAVDGDRRLLTQAVVNLIENAMTHTPRGSTIRLDVLRRDHGAAIIVHDDGPGIPVEQRALALRRFGRLDVSRSTGGHGLGLPLVAAIARLHGGMLSLADSAPGLTATLTIGPAPDGP